MIPEFEIAFTELSSTDEGACWRGLRSRLPETTEEDHEDLANCSVQDYVRQGLYELSAIVTSRRKEHS
jgi:hypothetical protein